MNPGEKTGRVLLRMQGWKSRISGRYRDHRGRMVLEETVTNTKRDRDIQRHLVVVLVISSYSVLTPDRIAIKMKFLSIRN